MIVFRVNKVENLRIPATTQETIDFQSNLTGRRKAIQANGPKPKVKIELIDPRRSGSDEGHDNWETEAANVGVEKYFEWMSNNEHAFSLDAEYYTRSPTFKVSLINARDNSVMG